MPQQQTWEHFAHQADLARKAVKLAPVHNQDIASLREMVESLTKAQHEAKQEIEPEPLIPVVRKTTPRKKAPAKKKTSAKKATTKKATTRKAAAKKTPAKKATAKKTSAKKPAQPEVKQEQTAA